MESVRVRDKVSLLQYRDSIKVRRIVNANNK